MRENRLGRFGGQQSNIGSRGEVFVPMSDLEKQATSIAEETAARDRSIELGSAIRLRTLSAELILMSDALNLDAQRRESLPATKRRKDTPQEEEFTKESFSLEDGKYYPYEMTYSVSEEGKKRTVLPKRYRQLLMPSDRFESNYSYPYIESDLVEGEIDSATIHLPFPTVENLPDESLLKSLNPVTSFLSVSLAFYRDSQAGMRIISYVNEPTRWRKRRGMNSSFLAEYYFNPSNDSSKFERGRSDNDISPVAFTKDEYLGLLTEILDFIPQQGLRKK